ncbi:MAG TPA: hypothetical protein VN956_25415 [Pyrinomonadaceae bacterium]|nr:hypothetical protein [Pyrinomonadaceae bacterium]
MKGQRLRQGLQIKLSGQRYSIEKRLANGELQLKHLATETLCSKPEAEILKALFEGIAELLGANGEVENGSMYFTQLTLKRQTFNKS